jgi:hypothetical protein
MSWMFGLICKLYMDALWINDFFTSGKIAV